MVLLLDRDLVEVSSGEILTVVGNYSEDRVRGRASYIPNLLGNRLVDGRSYEKNVGAHYNIRIQGARKVLDLPGEEHFILPIGHITRHWPTLGAERNLGREDFDTFSTIVNEVNRYGLHGTRLGIGGSTAVNARLDKSDFDIIAITKNPDELISALNFFSAAPPFSREFAVEKYRPFNLMSEDALWTLFERRKKYLQIGMTQASISFVDDEVLHDRYLDMERSGHLSFVRGEVRRADRGHFPFSEFEIVDQHEIFRIFSPLYFYRSAFQEGDRVEGIVELGQSIAGEHAIVEGVRTFIRSVS